MATPDPYWTDGRGNRLPKKPCPRCGANVGPMPLRVEHLRHLGWAPYRVQSYQSWCGHTQEIIPFPRADGSVLFIDVIGWTRRRSVMTRATSRRASSRARTGSKGQPREGGSSPSRARPFGPTGVPDRRDQPPCDVALV